MCEEMTKKDVLQQNQEERIDIMAAAKILRDEKVYAKEMKIYVQNLEKQSRESNAQAKEAAIIALKKTGVINPNGSVKKKIVSWE